MHVFIYVRCNTVPCRLFSKDLNSKRGIILGTVRSNNERGLKKKTIYPVTYRMIIHSWK